MKSKLRLALRALPAAIATSVFTTALGVAINVATNGGDAKLWNRVSVVVGVLTVVGALMEVRLRPRPLAASEPAESDESRDPRTSVEKRGVSLTAVIVVGGTIAAVTTGFYLVLDLPLPGDLYVPLGTAATVTVLVLLIWALATPGSGGPVTMSDQDVELRVASLIAALEAGWLSELALRQVDAVSVLTPRRHRVQLRSGAWTPVGPSVSGGLIDSYREMPSRRMVVLGGAGAGKSVAMAQLALAMCGARTPKQPVPVLLSAATWPGAVASAHDGRGAPAVAAGLVNWIESELIRINSGLEVAVAPSTTLAHHLASSGMILPLIDEIDHLQPPFRSGLLQALNAAAADANRLSSVVIASRPKEYTEVVDSTGPLTQAAQFMLEDVPVNDAVDYLCVGDERLWAPVRQRVREDELAAARFHTAIPTPLMAFLARAVYQPTSSAALASPPTDPAELLAFDTPDAAQVHLLAGFIPAVYRDSDIPIAKIERYYRFLAANLHNGDIVWWKLWGTISRFWRAVPLGMLGGLLGGALGFALWQLSSAPVWMAIAATSFGVLAGVLIAVNQNPREEPAEFRFHRQGWRECGASPSLGLGAAGLTLLTAGLATRLFGPRQYEWWLLPVAGLVAGCGPGLVVWNLRREIPGSAARLQEVKLTAPAGALGATVVALIGLETHARLGTPLAWVVVGLAFGLLSGLAYVPKAPVPIAPARSMGEMITSNRNFTLYFSVMFAGAYSLILWAMLGWVPGVIAGAAIGVMFGFSTNIWGHWLIYCRIWLRLRGLLPAHFEAFIEDGCRRGVLYRSGSAYRFRHALLEKHLRQPAVSDG
ncbi:hypothetical protein [Nocardia africana]